MEQIEIISPKQKCLEQALSLRVGVMTPFATNNWFVALLSEFSRTIMSDSKGSSPTYDGV